jgi:hypothetical protein
MINDKIIISTVKEMLKEKDKHMYEDEIAYQADLTDGEKEGLERLHFTESLTNFLQEMKRLSDEDYAKNYANLTPPTFKAEEGGKYIRVIREQEDGNGSMVAFIAKSTFYNKTMGHVKIGDIFKAATYKAPAKHARGNIFDKDNGFSAFGRGGTIRYMGS